MIQNKHLPKNIPNFVCAKPSDIRVAIKDGPPIKRTVVSFHFKRWKHMKSIATAPTKTQLLLVARKYPTDVESKFNGSCNCFLIHALGNPNKPTNKMVKRISIHFFKVTILV